MIQITPQMRIVVAVDAVDFRRGIDGLARLCKEVLKADPFSGWLFVFRSRAGKSIKILVYDGQGFWLCQKRLSCGRFRFWPHSASEGSKVLQAHELQILVAGGNPLNGLAAPAWRRVSSGA
jgi:transposase